MSKTIVWLACLHVGLAWAAPPDTLSETDYFAELPVVLSASRLSQPVSRAPAAVSVLTREMIEASGARQLPDLLRLVPGFNVSWRNGSVQAATYQGLSSIFSRHMQVLVDGRSVYNPGYGSVQWRGIPLALDDIERIEVVRGPNAANDGINAVVASIHLYTRPASAEPGWTVAGAVGSEDILDGLLRYAGGSGDWQFRATLNGRQDDWLDNHDDLARDHLIDVRAEWRPNDRDEITLQAGGSLGFWDESSVGFTLSPQQTTDYSSAYAQARWRRTLSADHEWSLLFHYTAARVEETFPPLFGVLDPDNINYRYSRSALEFSSQNRLSESLRTVWTVEARQDRARSPSMAEPDTHQGNIYRLSGNAEWSPAEEWVFHAGAMLEDHYYAGTRLSPRLAVNWLPEPGHSFRAGVSRAYRSPTFLEQESDFKLTADLGFTFYHEQILLSPYELDPERMDSAELGYLFHDDRLGLDLDVRVFYNHLQDIIDIETGFVVPGETFDNITNIVFANLYDARQYGGEYQLRWQAARTSWVTLSQSWVQTDGDTEDLSHSAPPYNLSLLANHDFGPVTGSLGYYRTATMRWVNSDRVVPAHDRLDLRLAHAFKIGTTRAELAVVAQSVLGKYSEYGVDRWFQPRAYVSFKANF